MNRIAFAAVIGVLGFLLYIGLAVTLADHVLEWHWLLQIPYFALAGVAWAWPAHKLILWAARKA